jgi:DNA mismatch repair protein MutH
LKPSPQLDLIPPPPSLRREEAQQRLEALVGVDLGPLAVAYGITVERDGRRNKGWAGHVVERFLGRSPNADKAADFGDWELKVVSVVPDADGRPRVKDSMAIAQFTPAEIERDAFEDSHLLDKLRRLLIVVRLADDPFDLSSALLGAMPFDLDDPVVCARVHEDYDEIRWVVRSQGAYALSGHIGRLIQPRPRGDGSALGFYARARFVAYMLGIEASPE